MTPSAYFPFHYKLLRFFCLGAFRDSRHGSFDNFSNPLYVAYSALFLGFWVLLFTVALWMEVPNVYNDLDRLMLNLSFSVTFTLSSVKIYIVLRENQTIQETVRTLEHDMVRRFSQNGRIKNDAICLCRRLTVSILAFANLTVIGLIVGGVYQAAANSSKMRILPMPVYIPFDVDTDFKYALAFAYQILGVQWYGNLVVVINTFTNTILIHLAARFQNLSYVVENVRGIAMLSLDGGFENVEGGVLSGDLNIDMFDDDGKERYAMLKRRVEKEFSNDEIDKRSYLCLRECIIHHTAIIGCVENFEKIYNVGFLVHVINNLNIICHVMIQIFENDVFSIRFGTAIALFSTVVCELLVQCYAGNELSLQAMAVSESVYNCRWYSFEKRIKNILLILMVRSQRPINVTAGKFVAVSNATFVAIMRGAYSFFTVIRSTRDN